MNVVRMLIETRTDGDGHELQWKKTLRFAIASSLSVVLHTLLMISLAIVLIRNSLHSLSGGKKNKVEGCVHSRRINLFAIDPPTFYTRSFSVPGPAPLPTLSP